MKPVSFIVPVYNEEENVDKLHREIHAAGESLGVPYEIIMVDDGSTDGTYGKLKQLHPVKIIRMRSNFGQTSAMDAGIKAAKYPYLITLDADLQNDPADAAALIAHLEENDLDVVSGWRKNRKDSPSKKFVSRVANFLRSILVKDGIHDSGCTLKVYKKECFEHVHLYGEMHRFIPAILKMRGFLIGEIVVHHRSRHAGSSKYTFKRTLKGFADMVMIWYWNKYAVRPFHFLGGIGLIIIMFSMFSAVMSMKEFFRGQDMSETFWPMFTLLSFLIGIQFLILGFISDMLMKTYFGQTGQTAYTIKNVVENE